MTHPDKLTLERLAALAPVTYAPSSPVYPTLLRMEERCRLHEQAAPRLLAALRALAERWDTRAVDEHPVCEGSNCAGCAYSMCAATLRALLTDLDLRAEPGGAR